MLQDNFLVQPNQILIEVQIKPQGPNTNAQTPFQNQEFLTNRPIIGIQVFSAVDMPTSPISGLPVITDALFPYAFLNIMRSGRGDAIPAGVWYKNIPLCTLRHQFLTNNANVSANLDMFRCDPMYIQWTETNISFPSSQLQATTMSVPLLISFVHENQRVEPYIMARSIKK